MKATNLEQYLLKYGMLLGARANESLQPLHVPGRDPLPALDVLRRPFEPQGHVVEALTKALRRQKSVLLVAECGTGKTLMSMLAVHRHAAGRPYRALVFCPGQLVEKWEREVRMTLPGVTVRQMDNWKDFVGLDPQHKPASAGWYVVSRDRAKLGSGWTPAVMVRSKMREQGVRCPTCGGKLLDVGGLFLSRAALDKSRKRCEYVLGTSGEKAAGCGGALWRSVLEPRRYAPAQYVQKKLKGFFDYLVLDEAHEEKSADSAQGNAAGKLAAACKRVLALTGTLVGGYAEHLRPLLFRLAPDSLRTEGLEWSESLKFSQRYGRVETTVWTRNGKDEHGQGDDNRMSCGRKGRTMSRRVRPGVVPTLFGRHLLDKAVFLSLDELAENLPAMETVQVPVAMDPEMSAEYRAMADKLRTALKAMVRRGDRRLLGAMLQTLLAYPDLPFGWGPVGYHEGGEGGGRGAFRTVVVPANLNSDVVRPKEKALVEFCKAEVAAGHKVWVYVQYASTHDVQRRLERLLGNAGLRVGVLRSSVAPATREEWMKRNGPKCDVVVSHPKLVETGLDFFDRERTYNFNVLAFYETGFNLFTLRQAGARAWRVGQEKPCKVAYFYYEKTMQENALRLMGTKMGAAQALEGRFSEQGLVALAGDEGDEMALAKTMFDRMDRSAMDRVWKKVTVGRTGTDETRELASFRLGAAEEAVAKPKTKARVATMRAAARAPRPKVERRHSPR